MITGLEQIRKKISTGLTKIRSYGEIVEFLDAKAPYEYSQQSVQRMKDLDAALGNMSSQLDIIAVAGTNGKSSALNFAAKLLKEEGLKVGLIYSTHVLNYNERLIVGQEQISNKSFADVFNDVVTIAEMDAIQATAYELSLAAGLLYFSLEKVDVVLVEVAYGGKHDAVAAFNPKIAAVTRVAEDSRGLLAADLDDAAFEMMEVAKPGTWFVSAEQSKLRLQKMKNWCDDRKIVWTMPIRKLASLPYIYEQLYGRTASLGERIAQIYVEDIKGKFSPFLRGNLLATQKGQRGRPTLEAKRNAELNPIKTLKGFWTENFDLLNGRFQHLDKEKPSILLDNASNIDALTNLFLGIRLLHYQKPLKGLAVVLSLSKAVNAVETLKLIRYLMKKVNGSIFFVQSNALHQSHDIHELAAIAKDLNIKAKAVGSFQEGFDLAKASVDERDGLLVVAGSNELVTDYWKMRGIKKV